MSRVEMMHKKYKPYPAMELSERSWPSKVIRTAPRWCSVDLRDGNQALVDSMNLNQKLEMFLQLVELGFKEIEIGFPSSSKVEFEFLRVLIEKKLIPDDVVPQLLCQAREDLIVKSFEAFKDSKVVIFHMYNSTSTLQRDVVFKKSKEEIVDLAVKGIHKIKELSEKNKQTKVILEYSPESFTGTEMPYALEVCEKVFRAWNPKKGEKIILNLPATVEMSTPNVFADQIEWFSKNFSKRDQVIISVHPHNDRGTAVAACELALMAGADRVEGTLFGNGERTGNVDIINLAMNLHTQGVDPRLHIRDINQTISIYEKCTGMKVHNRHPYAGELVFTAFSGSHQDAISKGLKHLDNNGTKIWEVPYLPLDPKDIGRKYEKLIRINSQSGKGGIAYILEKEFGFKLPKGMYQEFGKVMQVYSDKVGREVLSEEIFSCFESEYLLLLEPFALADFVTQTKKDGDNGNDYNTHVEATLMFKNEKHFISTEGFGPIEALVKGINQTNLVTFSIKDFSEHSLNEGADAHAVAFIQVENEKNKLFFGVGVDPNIEIASAKAIISALNRNFISYKT